MDRHTPKRLAAVAVSAAFAAALLPSTAAAGPAGPQIGESGTASPEMLAAMERDLDLTPSEVEQRITADFAASEAMESLDTQLGTSFGGAWLAGDQQLMVAVTDPADAEAVRAAGGEPQLVTHSAAELDGVMDDLNTGLTPADEVYGWYVDVATNSVVVEAAPEAADAAAAWVEANGVDAGAVRVDTTSEAPQLLFDVVGGDAYFPGSSRCSVGFSVSGGFVTAGHCGGAGTSTSGYNGAAQGTVQAAAFPGDDMGWVSVNSDWSTTNLVNTYPGTTNVSGSSQAGVGSSICRSGSTTGWHCGTVEALNQTVTYPQGTVTGLTRTSACAEPGDSGGSFISGSQAQGVTSGGSGNCSAGGTTYFQPLNPILSTYGLSLVTS